MNEKTNDDLLATLAQPEDWQPGILDAARAQLQSRGFEFSPHHADIRDPEFDDLQRVASYRELLKTLRPRGIGSIVWGLIAIGIGLAEMDASQFNLVLAMIGVLLVIEGIWVIVAPAPVGMLVDGLALFILGVWNLAVTIVGMSSGKDALPIFILIGAVQIGWAGQSLSKYANFSKTLSAEASPETVQKFNQIVRRMEASDMTSDATLVEFVTSGPALLWKAQLRTAGAVFVGHPGRKVSHRGKWADGILVLATKQEVSFRKNGEGVKPGTLKIAISVKGRKSAGVMTQEAFRRYEAWKIGIQHRPDAS